MSSWTSGGSSANYTFNNVGSYKVVALVNDTTQYCDEAAVETNEITVYVHDPVYEIAIIQPDGGTIGGVTPIRVRVKTRSATLTHLEIKRHEDTTEHAWDWVNVKHGDPPTGLPHLESSSYDSGTGITTTIYRYDWDTTNSHNGNYILYAQGEFVTVPTAMVASEDYGGTAVKNLAIISCVPEGVAPWKGEEGTTVPIQVNLEDNDTSDPMTLTLTLYATNADNRGPWTGIRTMIQENVTGTTYTFYWDGKNNSGAYVDPWTYTFEVDITQTDINYNENPALQVADATEYRSRYLHILRSRDAFNNPIYEAEYAGYDEGDPNDPNDDSYLYYIRFYDLKDTLDVDASEGELWLYDPNVEKIYSWDVANLECLAEGHQSYDGLHASSTGITHKLLVPVPISLMEYAGDYRFVLHIKDDHLDKYRDHRKRWARDLNAKRTMIGVAVFTTNEESPENPDGINGDTHGDYAYSELKLINPPGAWFWEGPGYRGWAPLGDPANGGSGRIGNTSSRLAIHTLNRIASGDTGKKHGNAVWAFYGHGCGAIEFKNGGVICNGWPEDEDNDIFSIASPEFNNNFILLAYLMACESAGGGEISANDSIAKSFFDSGAKSVVGFAGIVHGNTKLYMLFEYYFWRGVCREGKSVGEAVTNALKKIPREVKKKAEKDHYGITPRTWGGNKVLYPPRYGN